MNKLISKLKIRDIIIELSLLSVGLIFFSGIFGIKSIKLVSSTTNEVYNYYNWSNTINNVEKNITELESIRLFSEIRRESIGLEKLKEVNEEIIKDYEAYTDAGDGELDPEEKVILDKFYINYNEYNSIITKLVNQYINNEEIDEDQKKKVEELEQSMSENMKELKGYLHIWAEEEMINSNKLYKSNRIIYFWILIIIIIIITLAAVSIVKSVNSQLNNIIELLKKVSEGNLSIKAKAEGNTEFDEMKKSINITIDSFNNIIADLKDKSTDIDGKAEELSAVSEELTSSVNVVIESMTNVNNGTKEQSQYMNETNELLINFSKIIDDFLNDVNYLDDSSNIIKEKTNFGNEKMDDLAKTFVYISETMKQFLNKIVSLSNSLNDISNITNLINDISEQTNLLALNAAIESARVGEAGKGFAVVAEEIRELAEQSQSSANDISLLVENLFEETNDIVKESNMLDLRIIESSNVINDSIYSFKGIVEAIDDINPKIDKLNLSSGELNDGINAISRKIQTCEGISNEISKSTQDVYLTMQEINQGSESVADAANNLNILTNDLEKKLELFVTK